MSFGVILIFFVFLLPRARGHRSMAGRDPEKFLTALTDAFRSQQDADQSLKAQFLYFSMSMSAVPIRLTALDALAAKFPQASINANTDLGKRQEQNQILFDFFSNAFASIESFCCGSYFVGSVLDPSYFGYGTPVNGVFTQLRKISPESTLLSYEKFAATSSFAQQLRDCWDSDERKLMDKIRNLLVHRVVPGRSIRMSTIGDLPHKIDLDQWYEGDMTRIHGGSGLREPTRAFELDDNCLVRQRDWIDKSIEGLAEHLTDLAKANGLG
jgi:hypothetical protein